MNRFHVATICQQAHDLIEDGTHWTQGVGAVDIYGRSCHSTSVLAVKWCAVGALTHVANRLIASDTAYSWQDSIDTESYVHEFRRNRDLPSIIWVNDRVSLQSVLELLQQIIQSLNPTETLDASSHE